MRTSILPVIFKIDVPYTNLLHISTRFFSYFYKNYILHAVVNLLFQAYTHLSLMLQKVGVQFQLSFFDPFT